MMNCPRISAELDPNVAEIQAAIWQGLREFNERHAGPAPSRPIAVFVRDEGGVAIGGLEANLRWGWLYIDNFWIPDELRGQGLGTKLLRTAEQLALEHGCTRSYLDTFEFQALAFYKQNGYSVFGVLEGFPPGFRRYFLQKNLTP